MTADNSPCHSKRTKIAVITSRSSGTGAAIAAWKAEPHGTRGGQPRYSALAITTVLTLRAVFRLALRQTEGPIAFHHRATIVALRDYQSMTLRSGRPSR